MSDMSQTETDTVMAADPNVVPTLGGVRYKGSVMIAEEPPQGMITVRGDLASAKMKKAVGEVPALRKVVFTSNTEVFWMSPDELMVLCPYAEVGDQLAKIEAALAGTHHLAVDVSDARAMFSLSGEKIREVLAKLTPADLRPSALPALELRRTRLAQVPAAFWLRDDAAAQIICFRSVARYVFDVLKGAADPLAEVECY